MRAVIWDKPGDLRIADVPDPTPGRGELVIRVGVCGICGTDVHIADGEFPPSPYPLIPGHEFAGQIVARGDGVPGDWREGQRDAVDPSLYCGYCAACRAGRGNLCANWNAIGDTVSGAFAEYVAVPFQNAYPIPDGVDAQQGALIEPLSCAVHAMNLLGPVVADDVLVIGAGTMGLLLLQLLQRSGAASTTGVDRKGSRLETPRALGGTEGAGDVSAASPGPFAVAVDATGAPPAIEAAFGSLDRGGRLLIFGVASGDAEVSLSPFRIYNDEIQIIWSMDVLKRVGAAAGLMAAGALDTAPLLGPPAARAPGRGHPPGVDGCGGARAGVGAGGGVKVPVAPGR